MQLKSKIHRQLREILLGRTNFPEAVDLPMENPQTEVSIWMHGLGEPRNVTSCHSVACAAPFTFCIGFKHEDISSVITDKNISLKFCESTGERRVLGEIGLKLWIAIPTKDEHLYLFNTISYDNFCIPQSMLWMHNVSNAYARWKYKRDNTLRISALDAGCNAVTFICPRPVVLVSLLGEGIGNIFPMNLFGTVGKDYVAFALNSERQAASVSQVKHVALSNIPFNMVSTVRELGKNHRHKSIDWNQLKFPTNLSKVFKIPIPDFALRVRELKVEYELPIGSHTFFLGRIIEEENRLSEPEFHMIHGHYAAYCRNHHNKTE
jgi:flavin reductase (DIM6/NTAB) family NADH-FMN oxidoreductase RutF